MLSNNTYTRADKNVNTRMSKCNAIKLGKTGLDFEGRQAEEDGGPHIFNVVALLSMHLL
jgi:hypothetical protein